MCGPVWGDLNLWPLDLQCLNHWASSCFHVMLFQCHIQTNFHLNRCSFSLTDLHHTTQADVKMVPISKRVSSLVSVVQWSVLCVPWESPNISSTSTWTPVWPEAWRRRAWEGNYRVSLPWYKAGALSICFPLQKLFVPPPCLEHGQSGCPSESYVDI